MHSVSFPARAAAVPTHGAAFVLVLLFAPLLGARASALRGTLPLHSASAAAEQPTRTLVCVRKGVLRFRVELFYNLIGIGVGSWSVPPPGHSLGESG